MVKEHHVCLFVKDFDKELKFYRDILGLKVFYEPVVRIAHHEDTCPSGTGTKMNVCLLGVDRPFIELIEDTEYKGEYQKGLKSKIEHICFEVSDLREFAKKLKEKGIKFTRDVYEIGMYDLKYCCFIEDPEGVKIEFLEKK